MRFLLLLCFVAPAFCAEQRIVGGSDVSISKYPWQLSLRVSETHYCGATLITNSKAITSAHCATFDITVYTLLGGTANRTDTTCTNCQLFPVGDIITHPRYNEDVGRYPFDVSVLLFNGLSLNPDFDPITMARPEDGSFAGERCVITGWGLQQPGGDLPILLQGADVTVMTNADCSAQWGTIDDTQICITDADSGVCNGDRGGPLVCGGILAGQATWGDESCSPQFPTVYTRISEFSLWIASVP